jgi:hypothetical protein
MSNVVSIKTGRPIDWSYLQYIPSPARLREILKCCFKAVPKEEQGGWILRVASSMTCQPREVAAYIANTITPQVSIRCRLESAAISAVEPRFELDEYAVD